MMNLGKKIIVGLALSVLACAVMAPCAAAAVGDAMTMYGNNTAPAGAPKIRSYTMDAGGTGVWSGENALATVTTKVVRSVIKANPQANEYIAGVGTSGTNHNLYIYTYSGGSWALSWATTLPSAIRKTFDVEYEQSSGDAIAVYSSGTATTNQLAFRKRVDGVWDAAPTSRTMANATGVIYWLELEPRPSTDEIALAYSDSQSRVSALIWDGSAWGAEPAAVLNATASTTDCKKVDVAYEQVTGDCMVLSGVQGNNTTVKYSLKLAGQTVWNTSNLAVSNNAAFVDLSAEPGSDYIGFASMSSSPTAAALQGRVWTGTAWTGPNSTLDTAGSAVAFYRPVSCGWVQGVGATNPQRRLMLIYADTSATARVAVTYYTFKKSTSVWDQAANTPATYSPPRLTTSVMRNIFTEPDANFASNGKLWVGVVDTSGDYWTFTTTGTGAANWLTVDSGAAGNNPVESNVNVATMPVASLAVTGFNPTVAELIELKAEQQDEKAVIRWKTASEMLTKGFRLYRTFSPDDRKSYEDIAGQVIRAAGNPFSGHAYEFTDPKPLTGSYYILEEVLNNGRTRVYPAVLLTGPGAGDDANTDEKPFFGRDGKFLQDGMSISRRLSYPRFTSRFPLLGRTGLNLASARIKCEVSRAGLYRLTRQDLSVCGWDVNSIDPVFIHVSSQGKEIPVFIATRNLGRDDVLDYLEFYGTPATTRYTKANVYWVSVAPGKGLRSSDLIFTRSAALQDAYQKTEEVDGNVAYYPEFKGDQHWFFSEEFISLPPDPASSYNFGIDLDHLASSRGSALVSVGFQGGSRIGIGPDFNRQHALVKLNGTFIGEANWEQDVPYTFTQSVPASLLREGSNTLTIAASDEGGVLQQYFLLAKYSLIYPRKLWAQNNQIIFDSNAGKLAQPAAYKVRGFTSDAITVMAWVEETGQAYRIINTIVKLEPEGDYSITFKDGAPVGKKYILSADHDLLKPDTMAPDVGPDLKSRANQADYIIITHHSFTDALAPLVGLRRSQGLGVMVVDVQDIYNQFNYGVFSPQAIKDFLAYAHSYWRGPAPLFVLLAGDATFDYQDYMELGVENLVPAYLVYSSGFGETVSDNWYADIDDDALPEMFIGRLPVNTPAELSAVIDKITAYENTAAGSAWARRLLFVADDEADFEESSDALAGLVPDGYDVEQLYVRDTPPADVRSGIINGINQGQLMFTYTGHAGVQLLSGSDVFNNGDVASLTNASMYPVFASLNCLTGYFIYPQGFDGLAETLLRAANKGAVACVSPSGFSSPPEQSRFMQGFYRDIFESGDYVLGAILFAGQKALGGAGIANLDSKEANVIRTYNLLGDPATIIRKDGAPTAYTGALLKALRESLSE